MGIWINHEHLMFFSKGADLRNAQRIQYENRLSASTTGSISPDPWPMRKETVFSDFSDFNTATSRKNSRQHTHGAQEIPFLEKHH